MEWTECIRKALDYIESHLTEELSIEEIARQAAISPFYFQKGFAMLCGFSVGEYLKKRRLTLAGSELVSTGAKIIDIALKYGYDSPDSFAKAFTRFHGATPSAVRTGAAVVRSFAPLHIKFTLDGGYTMDYRIVEKDQFTVVGLARTFSYGEAEEEVPKLWQEFGRTKSAVRSVYGISVDESMEGDCFEQFIGDDHDPAQEVPEGFCTRVIPPHTWAVFACRGPASRSLRDVHQKIFSEWLPNNREYEIAAGCYVERYGDPAAYAKGVEDDGYTCEIWIPVRRK